MITNIIFDFDGVLHDTTQIIFQFNARYSDFTHQETLDAFKGNVFQNKEIKKVPQEEYFNSVAPHYKELVVTEDTRNFLQTNSDRNMFIISSGDETILNEYVSRNNISHFFKQVMGYNTNPLKTEKFKILMQTHGATRENTIFITDTLGDILEANEVGIRTIGVEFGLHDREVLSEGNPQAICSTWDQVQDVLNHI